MGRNRVSDDLNHVADAPTTTTQSKQPPPKPKPIFRFKLMKINNITHELDKLPSYVVGTPYNVFSLFFNDDILQKIVDYINEYAKKHSSNDDKPHARK